MVLGAARAQAQPQPPDGDAGGAGDVVTRAAALAGAKEDKAKALRVYEPNTAERWLDRAETLLLTGGLRVHPFFENAYAGGGFTLGAGYRRFVSPYNTVDLRGSLTFSGYKRIEAEFLAPRLFKRRAVLSVLGGWREATQVGFYGIGTGQTSKDDRANYSFTRPYVSGRIEARPTRLGGRRRELQDLGGTGAGRWHGSIRRGDLHAGDAARWAQSRPPACGLGGSIGARQRATRRSGGMGDGPRRRPERRLRLRRVDSTPFSTSRSCARTG
jgi:hypothetical protein